ncbi:MAG: DUF4034 domain-containing protein [Polyangiaceae bacterium]
MELLTIPRLAIASVVVVAIGAAVFIVHARRKAAVTAAREARQAPVIDVAPAAITDKTTVLAGPEGVDADGYPTQYADKVVLKGLLLRARYDDLDKAFAQFQDAAEKDDRHEYWIIDAGDAFATADPSIKEKLDAWATASPNSFAPFFARGTYIAEVGFVSRGAKWSKDTPKEDFAAMTKAFGPAQDDLARALSMRPKLVAAKRVQIKMDRNDFADRDPADIVNEATKMCPGCFQIRVTYLFSATPRWGGSYEEMQSYVSKVSPAANPRLRLLPGYLDYDRASIAAGKKDYATALASIEKACALGDGADFFYMRGNIHGWMHDWTAAKQDYDRAIAIRPEQPDFLADRANAELDSKSYEASATDLLTALRIDPTSSYARTFYEGSVRGIIYKGWEAQHAGNFDEALRLYDLAGELAPADHDLQTRRADLLAGSKDHPSVDVASAAAVASSGNVPDDIEEVRKMDYSLARQHRFSEIVPLWDAYIAKHPDDGRAYLERGGTYFNLRQMDKAGEDARKACDLGVNEGCLRARQLGK